MLWTIQEVTLDELEERSETLRIKREAEKAETRITRAQMEKWTPEDAANISTIPNRKILPHFGNDKTIYIRQVPCDV